MRRALIAAVVAALFFLAIGGTAVANPTGPVTQPGTARPGVRRPRHRAGRRQLQQLARLTLPRRHRRKPLRRPAAAELCQRAELRNTTWPASSSRCTNPPPLSGPHRRDPQAAIAEDDLSAIHHQRSHHPMRRPGCARTARGDVLHSDGPRLAARAVVDVSASTCWRWVSLDSRWEVPAHEDDGAVRGARQRCEHVPRGGFRSRRGCDDSLECRAPPDVDAGMHERRVA